LILRSSAHLQSSRRIRGGLNHHSFALARFFSKLGVTAVGHRLKLLDAIAALRPEGGAKAPSPAASPAGQSATPPSVASVVQAKGERRYLTVLFCDLVGSTSISARLDAEEWRDLAANIWMLPLRR
jgi:hypothetical protein